MFIDDNELLEISSFTLGKFGLRKGDEISAEEIRLIKTAEEEASAKNIAINYLSYRIRSSKEVLDHLISKGIDRNCAENIVSGLQSSMMINDLKFANAFVKDKLKRKPIGVALLRQQLLAKGISRKNIDIVFNELITTKNQETAAALAIKRKLSSIKYLKREPEKRKKYLMDFLFRRGFSHEIVIRIIRNIS